MALTQSDQEEIEQFRRFLEFSKKKNKIMEAYEKAYSSPKQVIVMRTDLNMRKGKMAAQAAHASMAVLLDQMTVECEELYEIHKMVVANDSPLYAWLNGPFKKICVGIDSEAELLELYEKAKAAGLPTALITDSGLTEFNGVKTHTCIAIGPETPDKIDPFTSNLKLL